MNARTVSWVLGGAVAVYLFFVAARAWVLLASGDPVPMLLGASVIVIPIIGAWMLARELGFGFRTQELGRILGREGGLPVDDLPRTPSGRVQRDAADARFLECQREVERQPEDWRGWYRLAIAYDDARDRRRAREAMRTAIRLHRRLPSPD